MSVQPPNWRPGQQSQPIQRKPAFRGLMAIWSERLGRRGPRAGKLWFLVDLVPWLAFVAILAVLYLVSR